MYREPSRALVGEALTAVGQIERTLRNMYRDGIRWQCIQENRDPDDWWNHPWRVHRSTRSRIIETKVKEESKTQDQNHPIEYATLGNLWYLFDHAADVFKNLLTDPKRIHDFLSYIDEFNDSSHRGRTAHQRGAALSFDDVKRTIKKSLDIIALIPSKYHDTSGLGVHKDLYGSIGTAWAKVCQEEATYQYFNFPSQLKTFVGRRGEVKGIRELIQKHRLVTLLGLGGVGKTHLAMHTIKDQTAANLKTTFSDGIAFVPLDHTPKDSSAVCQAIAQSLGKIADHIDNEHALIRLFRQQHFLLLLDNWETVHAPETVSFLYRLLTETLYLHILVTSQRRIGMEGVEKVEPVKPMSTVGNLESLDAYHLFVERVRSNAPDWEPYGIDALGEVLKLTDGLPLCIELVAAHAHKRTLSQLAQELRESRLNVLRKRAESIPTGPKRHVSIEACCEWTYQLLPSDVQEFFPALCVFPDSFMSEAAAAVGIVEDAEPLLNSLHSASLIKFNTRTGHYSLLPIVREYALEKASDNLGTYRELYIEFFANIAKKYLDENRGKPSYEELVTPTKEDSQNFLEACKVVNRFYKDKLRYEHEVLSVISMHISVHSIESVRMIINKFDIEDLSHEQKEQLILLLRKLRKINKQLISRTERWLWGSRSS